jgi:hypothetical protein
MGTVDGVPSRLEGDCAVVSTAAGERRVPIAEIENVELQLESPGPE